MYLLEIRAARKVPTLANEATSASPKVGLTTATTRTNSLPGVVGAANAIESVEAM